MPPSQIRGPELSNGMEERKLGIALAPLAFYFQVICLTMEFKIAYVAAYLHSLSDFMLSVKLYLVKCKGEDLQKPCNEKAAGQNLGLKDPFNLEGLTYKLTQ